MYNVSSTGVKVEFSFNVQNFSTDGVGLFDQPHVVSVVSPSTIFPAGLPSLA